jgi:hypothetical protein
MAIDDEAPYSHYHPEQKKIIKSFCGCFTGIKKRRIEGWKGRR